MAVSWITFSLTNRCQHNCRHCFRDPPSGPIDLGLEVVERVLSQARSLYGCEHVGLTGGEPTLHPCFAEVVERIISQGFSWHMVTNGRRFEQKLIPLLDQNQGWQKSITAIDLSLDGSDAGVHDHIRGKGSFRAVMQAVTACHARALPFSLQMSLNAYNAHQLESLALLASQVGAGRVSFCMTQPTGTFLDQEMYLKPAQWSALLDRIKGVGRALKIPVGCAESLCCSQPFHACDAFRSEILNVDEQGHLVLCCQLSGGAGSGPTARGIADLRQVPLVDAHDLMLDLIHRFQKDKIKHIRARDLGPWDLFPCNYCQRYFEMPHWTGEGASGPRARRSRWRGAWTPGRLFGISSPVSPEEEDGHE